MAHVVEQAKLVLYKTRVDRVSRIKTHLKIDAYTNARPHVLLVPQ